MNEMINPSTRIAKQFRLDGKVAIVTGASKGIGESIARGLAEFGAQVVVSSRRQESVDAVAAAMVADGLDAIGVACKVGVIDDMKALYQATVDKYGGVDIIINNAATNPVYAPVEDVSDEAFDKIMNVNTKGPWQLAKYCLESMKSRGGGSIINIASVEGLKPSQGIGLYGVSKAAVISLSQVLAKEWGQYGIRVNAICPGLIKTKFAQALWSNEKLLKQVERHLPTGRIAEPDEMAGLAVYLASPAASYVTGSVFVADGGHMIA